MLTYADVCRCGDVEDDTDLAQVDKYLVAAGAARYLFFFYFFSKKNWDVEDDADLTQVDRLIVAGGAAGGAARYLSSHGRQIDV
jgi:hypothetical protein